MLALYTLYYYYYYLLLLLTCILSLLVILPLNLHFNDKNQSLTLHVHVPLILSTLESVYLTCAVNDISLASALQFCGCEMELYFN